MKPTSENSVMAKFAERSFHASRFNEGIEECHAFGLPYVTSMLQVGSKANLDQVSWRRKEGVTDALCPLSC
jgi:hypothetical protein